MPVMVEAKATDPSIDQTAINSHSALAAFFINVSDVLFGGGVVIAVTPRSRLPRFEETATLSDVVRENEGSPGSLADRPELSV